MKPFKSVTVYVEFRMKSAEGVVPADKLLRARVVKSVTQNEGVCNAFGGELLANHKYTPNNMSFVHSVCLMQLRGLAARVVFSYDPLLDLKSEEYPVDAESEVA